MPNKAFLFGLNYSKTPDSRLNGCINDVNNMAVYLKEKMNMQTEIYTDETTPQDTTFTGLIAKLVDIAIQSYTENLDFIWFHYSGHGTSILDRSGDEADGCDECLVPSDYNKAGVISDDIINTIFTKINPKTKVVCVFDCCHSGTIADVKYRWEDETSCVVENILCNVKCKMITLSGCMDNQTSSDAYNVTGNSQFTGAMTSCLLLALKETPQNSQDVFQLVRDLRSKLAIRGFPQVPKLCSTYNLAKNKVFHPQ